MGLDRNSRMSERTAITITGSPDFGGTDSKKWVEVDEFVGYGCSSYQTCCRLWPYSASLAAIGVVEGSYQHCSGNYCFDSIAEATVG